MGRYEDAARLNRRILNDLKDEVAPWRTLSALGGNLLRLKEFDEGTAVLTDLLLDKIATCSGPDVEELRAAWPGLATAQERPEDRPGQDGIELDGVDDYVVLPSLQFDGSPPWTLEVVVKPEELEQVDDWTSLVSAAEEGSIGLETSAGKWALSLYTADAYSRVWQNNYTTAVASKDAELHAWQHVAGVWDGKELRLYINGQLQPQRPIADRCTKLSPGPFFLGADPHHVYYEAIAHGNLQGRLRAARISRAAEYTESFTPPERLTSTPQTLALYDFTIDTGRYAIDRSGHGRHGIIVGAKFVKRAE